MHKYPKVRDWSIPGATSWHECECCHHLFIGLTHNLICWDCEHHTEPCRERARATRKT